ncbi:MAG: hypothetical protein HFI70_03865 [Lachnospiraceae bacterium]|nr:hypothetical protein [Lachnospiraceae bacterium]
MNSQDVISIIETLCEKLGIATDSFQDFVPELIKYRISLSVFWVVVSLLIILASVLVIRYTFKRAQGTHSKNYGGRITFYDFDDFPSVYISSIVGGILIFIFLFVFLFNFRRIVVCIASPQAYAIDYVLSYFK